MTQLETAVSIQVPTPLLGMNTKSPLVGMDGNYSPWILNMDCENQYHRLRNGVVVHCVIQDIEAIMNLGVRGFTGASDEKLFAIGQVTVGAGDNKVYDVSTSTESLAATTTTGLQADELYPMNFNRRLTFHGEGNWGNDDLTYDGSTWAVAGFTYGGSPIGGRVGEGYKGRPYLADNQYLYYPTSVGAVTGPLNREDVGSIFNLSANNAFMADISAPGDRPTETFFVIGNAIGEILIYSGDFPASATWGLSSRYKVAPLLGYNAVIRYNNDVLILTRTGIVSLRDLMSQGSTQSEQTNMSDTIDDYWRRLINQLTPSVYWGVPPSQISGCYWENRNKIIILVPGHIDEDGAYSSSAATMFVQNCTTRAWSIYKLANVDTSWMGGVTCYKGEVYFYTSNVVMKLSDSVFKDEAYDNPGSYSTYDWSLHGAYSNYGISALHKRVVGCQPSFKTDLTGTSVGMKMSADVRRQVSDVAQAELVDGFNSPFYSVGVDGTFFQYRMQGSSEVVSTDGLELYGMNISLVRGGRG